MKNDGPRSRQERAVILQIIAMLTFAVAAQLLWMSTDPERGLPPEGRLIAITGTLVKMTVRDDTVWFVLHEHKRLFRYPSKMGRSDAVARALGRRGAEVSLKYDPEMSSGPIDVFHLSVNGKVIRSYDEIRNSWIADNQYSGWASMLFALAGCYLLYAARRDLQGAKVSPADNA